MELHVIPELQYWSITLTLTAIDLPIYHLPDDDQLDLAKTRVRV